jgi:hypothetical protein
VHPEPTPYNIASYIVRLHVFEGEDGQFPFVKINIPAFGEGLIDLRKISKNILIDRYHKTIEISEPIEVREYSPVRSGVVARIGADEAVRSDPEGPPRLKLGIGLKSDQQRQPIPSSQ